MKKDGLLELNRDAKEIINNKTYKKGY